MRGGTWVAATCLSATVAAALSLHCAQAGARIAREGEAIARDLQGRLDRERAARLHLESLAVGDRAQIERLLVSYADVRDDLAGVRKAVGEPALDPVDLERRALLPTVRVRCGDSLGSGIVIGTRRAPGGIESYILTVGHLLSGGGDRVCGVTFFEEGQREQRDVRADAVAACPRADLALLRTVPGEAPPAIARVATPERADRTGLFGPVYAVGCPLGGVPVPTLGQVISRERIVDGVPCWMFSAQTIFGNSGGGVYAARTGELLGVAMRVCAYGDGGSGPGAPVPHLGVMVPVSLVIPWLREEGYGGLLGEGGPPAPPDAAPDPRLSLVAR